MIHDCENPNCSRCNPEPDEPQVMLDVDYDEYDTHEGVERDYEAQPHIVGGIYPAIETAYGRTVDHGFNIRIF